MRRLLPFVFALAACGKVNSLSDAPTGDGNGADSGGSIDGGFDADPHGSITVIVNDLNPPVTPLAGVPVVFVDASGAVTAEVATDASGKATSTILPGATVTAVYNAGSTNVQLETVRAVAPGDTIVIGPQYAGAGTGSDSFVANIPDDPGSQSYDVYGPCGTSSNTAAGSGALTPVSLYFTSNCEESTMDLLAISRNSDRTPTHWIDAPGVAFSNGGSADLAGTWQPFLSFDVSYTNVAAAHVGVIDVNRSAPYANGYANEAYASLGTDPEIVTLTVPGAATALVMSNIANNGGTGGQQQMYEVVDGSKTTYTVDLATSLLPFIGQPSFDPSTAVIDVPSGGGGGDVLQVTAQYSRVINDQTTTFTWEVWSPPADSITLPALPTDLAVQFPAAGDSSSAGASLYGADAITDWSQVREHLFSAWDAYYAGRSTIAAGRFVWSYPTGVGFAGRRHAR